MSKKMMLIMLWALSSNSLTLKQVSDLWLTNGFNFSDYAIWAAQYTGPNGDPVWGNIGGEWVYRGLSDKYHFATGQAKRTVVVRTAATLKGGVWVVEKQVIDQHTVIDFLPGGTIVEPVVSEPNDIIQWISDPPGIWEDDPNNMISTPIDPNALVAKVETLAGNDPNDIALRKLLGLLKEEKP